MVRIRLKRMGTNHKPFYRIVIADQRRARNGKFIETIGTYDPTYSPARIEVDEDRAKYWIGVGAQASDVVRILLTKKGLY
ncbi:MAG: 30S ribosomal protein S16 [Abditibacteriota bacterium]|nr:30S ribosomal protein S16 [Abditibacteriota bacterium]MBR4749767.1 30S ribosomal protein S16 [Abditibacteriota bacterium]